MKISVVQFKRFAATLKKKGKGNFKHKAAITQEDMDIIQQSLDLDDSQQLQDKVFMDVMLHFCNRGRECLRDMTRDSFEFHEEGGTGRRYISRKDTLTQNNREDQMEKRQDGVMTQTNGPRCPISSFFM